MSQDVQTRDQSYQEGMCDGRLAYYKPSSLYNVEKRGVSDRALAYDVVLANEDRVRILFDFATTKMNADIKVIISNSMNQSINLADAKIDLSIDQINSTQTIKDLKLKPGESNFSEYDLDFSKDPTNDPKTNFSLSNTDCLVQIPQFISFTKEDHTDGFVHGVEVSDESRSVLLHSGLNYLGFSDVHLTNGLEEKGVGVYAYNSTSKNWEKAKVMVPGLGYALFNADSKSKEIVFDNPFRTLLNDQSRAVKPGWNLMYNSFARDVSYDEYGVSFFQKEDQNQLFDPNSYSLSLLEKNHLVSDQIYLLKDGAINLNKSKIIPSASVFWLYVFSKPVKMELKPVGLDFKLEGVGDTYKPGQNVNFNFKVVNLNSDAQEVVSSGIDDLCSYGVRITDSRGKTIKNDLINRTCPNWPITTALQSKAKINYNYTWKVPDDALGKYKIEAYFDNYRGVLGTPVLKESLINIEK